MRDRRPCRTIRGMNSGKHRVTIELDASSGPPQGSISVDGGAQSAFFGWIDLTARLEALTRLWDGRDEAAGEQTVPGAY